MMTPLDIQNAKFTNSPMGYKKTEVDSFLAEVLAEYEKLYKEANEANEKVKSLSKLVESYKSMEETMKNTLVVAQQSAEQLTKAAKSEADAILAEANQKSQEIIAKSNNRLEELKGEYERAKKEIKSFMLKAKAEFEVQIKNLEDAQKEIDA